MDVTPEDLLKIIGRQHVDILVLQQELREAREDLAAAQRSATIDSEPADRLDKED